MCEDQNHTAMMADTGCMNKTPLALRPYRWLRRIFITGIFLMATGVTLAAFGQTIVEKILFAGAESSRRDADRPTELRCEEIVITTEDGARIVGWYFPAPLTTPTGDSNNISDGVKKIPPILFSHGNGGNVRLWSRVATELQSRYPVAVLIYDYRGYGYSEGTPTITGILSDARAARDWLCRRESLRPDDLIYYGRSLGGGVAVRLASETGAAGLVVESSFTSIAAMVRRLAPLLPFPARWLVRTDLDSIENIRHCNCPFLQSHGDADSLIPYAQAEELFAVAPGARKWFVTIPGGGHNTSQTEEFYNRLGELLKSI